MIGDLTLLYGNREKICVATCMAQVLYDDGECTSQPLCWSKYELDIGYYEDDPDISIENTDDPDWASNRGWGYHGGNGGEGPVVGALRFIDGNKDFLLEEFHTGDSNLLGEPLPLTIETHIKSSLCCESSLGFEIYDSTMTLIVKLNEEYSNQDARNLELTQWLVDNSETTQEIYIKWLGCSEGECGEDVSNIVECFNPPDPCYGYSEYIITPGTNESSEHGYRQYGEPMGSLTLVNGIDLAISGLFSKGGEGHTYFFTADFGCDGQTNVEMMDETMTLIVDHNENVDNYDAEFYDSSGNGSWYEDVMFSPQTIFVKRVGCDQCNLQQIS